MDIDNTRKDILIFWFDRPPKVSKGSTNYVSENWDNKVYYICDHDYNETRRNLGWADNSYGDAELVLLSKKNNPNEYIKKIIKEHPNAIHIINGFGSDIMNRIYKYLGRGMKNAILFSEKPTPVYQGIKGFVQRLNIEVKYRSYYYRYKNKLDAIIVLGSQGKDVIKKFGWNQNKIFPFMYCPELRLTNIKMSMSQDNSIKFLYVGRFNFRTRGLDVLMKAVDSIPNKENWSLDLVGGYGEDSDKVINWSKNQININYLGVWPSHEVGNKMKNYDVYVVPTKADGWNVQINEAIHAHLGIITTDQAVSDEMVKSGKMGHVIKSKSYIELANSMKYVIENPEKINEWKDNSKEYCSLITPQSVGDYFIKILNYLYYNSNEKPEPPWIK